MTPIKRLKRIELVELVIEGLPASASTDLPMIRQMLNDVADGYRKSGWIVPDWDQDWMVKKVRAALKAKGE